MWHIARNAVLVLGCCAAAAPGQEDDGVAPAASDLARVQRDQTRIGVRIVGLREKMERLAQRYEDEGRTRNATLLREALAEFEAKQVQAVARDLDRNLSQSNLSSVEQQDALVASLEQVYSVLRDRRDADELQRQTDLARKAVEELGFLAKNERRLLARTRAATDQPGSLLKQALELAAQLQQSLSSAGQATASTQAAEESLGDSALAEALLQEQAALAEDPAADADTQALLQQGLALLRERLEQPVVAADSEAGEAVVGDELLSAAQAARDEAKAAAAEAADAMEAAREQLERAAGDGATKSSPSAPAPGKAPSGNKAAGENAAGEKAAGEKAAGEKAAGEQAAGENAAGENAAGENAAGENAAGENAAGEEAAGEKAAGEKAAGEKAAGEQAAGEKPAGKPSGGKPAAGESTAGEKASGEPETPPTPEAAAAAASMEEATAALKETRDALERSERSLTAARNRARALAVASSAEAGEQADAMKELAERLEAVTPEAGPEMLDRTRQLLQELQKSAKAIDQGESAAASAAQQAARTSLDDLIKQLQARAGQTPDSEPRTPDAAELESLASQQQELQRQVNELMARLEELPDQEFRESSSRAGKAMGEAESALREGRTEEAAVREEEAAEQLEQAQEKLSGERDKYEQLRQEEVLFRVGEELKSLLEKHDAVMAETLELDAGRGDEERLGRSQRRTATRLAATEKDLSVQAEALRVALEKDGSVAFTFALDRCRDDLISASDLLADDQTGDLVQSVQADVRQRLVDLLAVLDGEQERRRNAKTEPPKETPPGQEQKTPLVPTVAELLLVQRMEQAALARLENFVRNNPGVTEEDGIDPVESELLGRWALEHSAVTDLFRRMIPSGAGGPGAPGGPDGPVGPDGIHPEPPQPEVPESEPPQPEAPPPGTEEP